MGEQPVNECDPRVQVARLRADRIKRRLGSIADEWDQVVAMIQKAKEADDASTLGYLSWAAYVAEEFGGVLPRLEPDKRRPLVHELRAMGMSTRDTAAVVGVHYSTVARDDSGVADATPVRIRVRPAVTGHDGKTYTPPSRPPLRPVPDAVTPVAHKRRRLPLTEQWRSNQFELRKVVERYERHAADDRFHTHRDALAGYASELTDLIDMLSAVHQQIAKEEPDFDHLFLKARRAVNAAMRQARKTPDQHQHHTEQMDLLMMLLTKYGNELRNRLAPPRKPRRQGAQDGGA